MDQSLSMSMQQEAGQDSLAMPFAIEDWLPSRPDRQVLVIGTNETKSRYNHGSAEFYPDDPTELPYDAGQFDLVICDFLSAETDITLESLKEVGRVIQSDGHLLIIDYLIPGTRLRGKKARQLRLAGAYINTWMRLRNSQHKRYLSQDAWTQLLADMQWVIQQMSTFEIPQDFDSWVSHYSSTANNRIRLQAMLLQAPEKVQAFLTPRVSGDRIAFRMTEIFILATKN